MTLLDRALSVLTFGASDQRASAPEIEKRAILPADVAGLLIPGWNGQTAWPKATLEAAQANYEKLALIFRCMSFTATSFAQAHLAVKERAPDGQDRTLEAHRLRALVSRPNPTMMENGFLSRVAVSMLWSGFCVIQKERSAGGVVINLWPLRSDRMRAVPKPGNTFDWEYVINGKVQRTLKADDVIVPTYADALDFSPFGQGPLGVIWRESHVLKSMTDFLRQFFDSGAVPLLGIVPNLEPGELLDQETIDALDKKFEERHLGLGNAVKPLWMQGVKDIKSLGFDMNQLAYVDLRDVSELAICTAFGIAPEMMGVRAGLEHSDSRANAEIGRKGFYISTVKPLWDRFDDVLTLGLLPEFEANPNIYLEFDTSGIEALQDNQAEKATWVLDLGRTGFATRNDIFDMLGQRIPKGEDFYLRPISVETLPADDPLGEAAAAEAQAQADAIAAGQSANPSTDQVQTEDGQDSGDQSSGSRGAGWEMEERASGKMLEFLSGSGPRERRAKQGVQSRKEIAKIARRAKPIVQRFLDGQEDRIVNRIMSAGDANDISVPLSVVIPWNTELAAFSRTMNKVYMMAGEAAYDQIEQGTGVGMSFNLANPHVPLVLDRVSTRPKGIRGITDQTQRDVNERLALGQAQGLTNKQMAESIRGLYQETYKGRSLTIARTETMVSYGYASTEGFRETGLVDRIQCFDNQNHTDDYGAEDGLSCSARDGFVDSLDRAELHIDSEHPNGSLVVTPILVGEPGTIGGNDG